MLDVFKMIICLHARKIAFFHMLNHERSKKTVKVGAAHHRKTDSRITEIEIFWWMIS